MKMYSKARKWNLDLDRYLNRVLPPSPLHKLPAPVSRFLGYRKAQEQDVGNILGAFWSMLGAFCGLAVIAVVFNNMDSIQRHNPPALIASFVCHHVSLNMTKKSDKSRERLQSWSTTPSDHRSANHVTLYLAILSPPSLAWASPKLFSTILNTNLSSGSQAL
jgi:hypothetical protein